jgi:hypothetical protein
MRSMISEEWSEAAKELLDGMENLPLQISNVERHFEMLNDEDTIVQA